MRKTLLALIAFGILAVSVWSVQGRAESTVAEGLLPSREAAVSRVYSLFESSKQPEIIDVRLLRHEEIHKIRGSEPIYESEWYRYERDTPVWVVTLTANDLSGFAIIDEVRAHSGLTLYLNAPDGNLEGWSTIGEPATDSAFRQILASPDLDGKLKIEPLPDHPQPPVPPLPTETIAPSMESR